MKSHMLIFMVLTLQVTADKTAELSAQFEENIKRLSTEHSDKVEGKSNLTWRIAPVHKLFGCILVMFEWLGSSSLEE